MFIIFIESFFCIYLIGRQMNSLNTIFIIRDIIEQLDVHLFLPFKIIQKQKNTCFNQISYNYFYLQSIERIPEKAKEFNEQDEDELDEEEESKFCTLPRSNNGFTIRHVSYTTYLTLAS